MSDFDVFGHSDSSVSGSEEMDIVNGAFYTNVQHQNNATECLWIGIVILLNKLLTSIGGDRYLVKN